MDRSIPKLLNGNQAGVVRSLFMLATSEPAMRAQVNFASGVVARLMPNKIIRITKGTSREMVVETYFSLNQFDDRYKH